MKMNARIVSFSLLAACLFLPSLASSEKPGKGSGGGKAVEHRSNRAAERSNAQWQEGASLSQDRANEVRDPNDDVDESKEARERREEKRAEKGGKKRADAAEADEGSESQESREARRDRREETQNRSFWQRTFGGGDPEQE